MLDDEAAKTTYRAWYPQRESEDLSPALARHARLVLRSWLEAAGGDIPDEAWKWHHVRAQVAVARALTPEDRRGRGIPDFTHTLWGRPFPHPTRADRHVAADALARSVLADLAPLALAHRLPLPTGAQLRVAAEDALVWGRVRVG